MKKIRTLAAELQMLTDGQTDRPTDRPTTRHGNRSSGPKNEVLTEVDFPMKWLIYIEENARIQTGDHKNKGDFN